MIDETINIHSWEDFKVKYSFASMDGQSVPADGVIFKFEYKDEAGNILTICNDGKKRTNNYIENGIVIGVFPRNTFVRGLLTVRRAYFSEDSNFEAGIWVFGDESFTKIKIL